MVMRRPIPDEAAHSSSTMRSEIVLQNSQTDKPLRIPLTVECNVSEERILANVLENARACSKWVKLCEPHDRTAIICGGGQSLASTLSEIAKIDGDVFALNGAAQYLSKRGIHPAFQVLMDAQPETAGLIGPARQHLFASQVDPKCFRRVPDAILWHTTYGELVVDKQAGFPEHSEDYCIIGAAVSVGNTALVLCHALGYRTIHVFGMDSSHEGGKSHAYRQTMNDGEPCTIVRLGDKKYICSVAMEMQARHFMERKAQLEAAGCAIVVHGYGLLPDMAHAPRLSEQEKYRQMWNVPEYRAFSPGENCADKFLALIEPKSSVIDFGCGTGRAGLKIENAGHYVTLVDFTDNCRDPQAEQMTFTKADLTKPLYMQARYGFCTDVMEHIPPSDVRAVIRNIMDCVDDCFFQISTVPDQMGAAIGQQLHLSVQSGEWWRKTFERLGYRVWWQDETSISAAFMVAK